MKLLHRERVRILPHGLHLLSRTSQTSRYEKNLDKVSVGSDYYIASLLENDPSLWYKFYAGIPNVLHFEFYAFIMADLI